MEGICLFFPACIALGIRFRRVEKIKTARIVELVFKWTGWVLVINVIVIGIITYVLGMEGVVQEAFNSFSFFIKYLLMAIPVSVILPYLLEIVEKYIEVSVEIGEQDEKDS